MGMRKENDDKEAEGKESGLESERQLIWAREMSSRTEEEGDVVAKKVQTSQRVF